MKSMGLAFVVLALFSAYVSAQEVRGNVDVARVCVDMADAILELNTTFMASATSGVDAVQVFSERLPEYNSIEALAKIVLGANAQAVMLGSSGRSYVELLDAAASCAVASDDCGAEALFFQVLQMHSDLLDACASDYHGG